MCNVIYKEPYKLLLLIVVRLTLSQWFTTYFVGQEQHFSASDLQYQSAKNDNKMSNT